MPGLDVIDGDARSRDGSRDVDTVLDERCRHRPTAGGCRVERHRSQVAAAIENLDVVSPRRRCRHAGSETKLIVVGPVAYMWLPKHTPSRALRINASGRMTSFAGRPSCQRASSWVASADLIAARVGSPALFCSSHGSPPADSRTKVVQSAEAVAPFQAERHGPSGVMHQCGSPAMRWLQARRRHAPLWQSSAN